MKRRKKKNQQRLNDFPIFKPSKSNVSVDENFTKISIEIEMRMNSNGVASASPSIDKKKKTEEK